MVKHIDRALKYIIIILSAILFLLLVFFIHEYLVLRRAQLLSAREFWTSAFIRHHGAPTPQEASLIAPWMTFGYVNTAFMVPDNYLQQQLSISDSHYPQITIGGYAKEQSTPVPAFDAEVQTAVRDYLITHQATSTTGAPPAATSARGATPTGTAE